MQVQDQEDKRKENWAHRNMEMNDESSSSSDEEAPTKVRTVMMHA